MKTVDMHVWRKQYAFITSTAFETLYGGAAGGGKSHAQLIDAYMHALKYERSKQLVFRRTYKDLEKSLIRKAQELYDPALCTYNGSQHMYTFKNGSIIDFGYLARDFDVYQYQSAEYDVIRFDELTHFTEFQYTYMISRCRGGNDYPKGIKSSTNPGNVGHAWVKKRFIDPAPPNTQFEIKIKVGNIEKTTTRIFIPAKVTDNGTIMEHDPDYLIRLESLSETEKRALRYGDWDIFDGQYFTEFSSLKHVCEPFVIPSHWRRYRAFDYGLDRLACMWVAVSPDDVAYVYREYCQSNLNIARAAKAILERTPPEEKIYVTLAPRDMWNRGQESGRSKADIFYENGLPLTQTSVDREAGWLSIKEVLDPGQDLPPKLQIFNNCLELIRCMPMLLYDPNKPTDCLTEPHEITHAPDALRYFSVFWHKPADPLPGDPGTVEWADDQWEDYDNADADAKARLIARWGKPKPRN